MDAGDTFYEIVFEPGIDDQIIDGATRSFIGQCLSNQGDVYELIDEQLNKIQVQKSHVLSHKVFTLGVSETNTEMKTETTEAKPVQPEVKPEVPDDRSEEQKELEEEEVAILFSNIHDGSRVVKRGSPIVGYFVNEETYFPQSPTVYIKETVPHSDLSPAPPMFKLQDRVLWNHPTVLPNEVGRITRVISPDMVQAVFLNREQKFMNYTFLTKQLRLAPEVPSTLKVGDRVKNGYVIQLTEKGGLRAHVYEMDKKVRKEYPAKSLTLVDIAPRDDVYILTEKECNHGVVQSVSSGNYSIFNFTDSKCNVKTKKRSELVLELFKPSDPVVFENTKAIVLGYEGKQVRIQMYTNGSQESKLVDPLLCEWDTEFKPSNRIVFQGAQGWVVRVLSKEKVNIYVVDRAGQEQFYENVSMDSLAHDKIVVAPMAQQSRVFVKLGDKKKVGTIVEQKAGDDSATVSFLSEGGFKTQRFKMTDLEDASLGIGDSAIYQKKKMLIVSESDGKMGIISLDTAGEVLEVKASELSGEPAMTVALGKTLVDQLQKPPQPKAIPLGGRVKFENKIYEVVEIETESLTLKELDTSKERQIEKDKVEYIPFMIGDRVTCDDITPETPKGTIGHIGVLRNGIADVTFYNKAKQQPFTQQNIQTNRLHYVRFGEGDRVMVKGEHASDEVGRIAKLYEDGADVRRGGENFHVEFHNLRRVPLKVGDKVSIQVKGKTVTAIIDSYLPTGTYKVTYFDKKKITVEMWGGQMIYSPFFVNESVSQKQGDLKGMAGTVAGITPDGDVLVKYPKETKNMLFDPNELEALQFILGDRVEVGSKTGIVTGLKPNTIEVAIPTGISLWNLRSNPSLKKLNDTLPPNTLNSYKNTNSSFTTYKRQEFSPSELKKVPFMVKDKVRVRGTVVDGQLSTVGTITAIDKTGQITVMFGTASKYTPEELLLTPVSLGDLVEIKIPMEGLDEGTRGYVSKFLEDGSIELIVPSGLIWKPVQVPPHTVNFVKASEKSKYTPMSTVEHEGKSYQFLSKDGKLILYGDEKVIEVDDEGVKVVPFAAGDRISFNNKVGVVVEVTEDGMKVLDVETKKVEDVKKGQKVPFIVGDRVRWEGNVGIINSIDGKGFLTVNTVVGNNPFVLPPSKVVRDVPSLSKQLYPGNRVKLLEGTYVGKTGVIVDIPEVDMVKVLVEKDTITTSITKVELYTGPSAEEMREQSIPSQGSPTIPSQGSPSQGMTSQGSPTIPSQGSPTIPSQGSPSQGSPTIPSQGSPGGPSQGSPTIPSQSSPSSQIQSSQEARQAASQSSQAASQAASQSSQAASQGASQSRVEPDPVQTPPAVRPVINTGFLNIRPLEVTEAQATLKSAQKKSEVEIGKLFSTYQQDQQVAQQLTKERIEAVKNGTLQFKLLQDEKEALLQAETSNYTLIQRKRSMEAEIKKLEKAAVLADKALIKAKVAETKDRAELVKLATQEAEYNFILATIEAFQENLTTVKKYDDDLHTSRMETIQQLYDALFPTIKINTGGGISDLVKKAASVSGAIKSAATSTGRAIKTTGRAIKNTALYTADVASNTALALRRATETREKYQMYQVMEAQAKVVEMTRQKNVAQTKILLDQVELQIDTVIKAVKKINPTMLLVKLTPEETASLEAITKETLKIFEIFPIQAFEEAYQKFIHERLSVQPHFLSPEETLLTSEMKAVKASIEPLQKKLEETDDPVQKLDLEYKLLMKDIKTKELAMTKQEADKEFKKEEKRLKEREKTSIQSAIDEFDISSLQSDRTSLQKKVDLLSTLKMMKLSKQIGVLEVEKAIAEEKLAKRDLADLTTFEEDDETDYVIPLALLKSRQKSFRTRINDMLKNPLPEKKKANFKEILKEIGDPESSYAFTENDNLRLRLTDDLEKIDIDISDLTAKLDEVSKEKYMQPEERERQSKELTDQIKVKIVEQHRKRNEIKRIPPPKLDIQQKYKEIVRKKKSRFETIVGLGTRLHLSTLRTNYDRGADMESSIDYVKEEMIKADEEIKRLQKEQEDLRTKQKELKGHMDELKNRLDYDATEKIIDTLSKQIEKITEQYDNFNYTYKYITGKRDARGNIVMTDTEDPVELLTMIEQNLVKPEDTESVPLASRRSRLFTKDSVSEKELVHALGEDAPEDGFVSDVNDSDEEDRRPKFTEPSLDTPELKSEKQILEKIKRSLGSKNEELRNLKAEKDKLTKEIGELLSTNQTTTTTSATGDKTVVETNMKHAAEYKRELRSDTVKEIEGLTTEIQRLTQQQQASEQKIKELTPSPKEPKVATVSSPVDVEDYKSEEKEAERKKTLMELNRRLLNVFRKETGTAQEKYNNLLKHYERYQEIYELDKMDPDIYEFWKELVAEVIKTRDYPISDTIFNAFDVFHAQLQEKHMDFYRLFNKDTPLNISHPTPEYSTSLIEKILDAPRLLYVGPRLKPPVNAGDFYTSKTTAQFSLDANPLIRKGGGFGYDVLYDKSFLYDNPIHKQVYRGIGVDRLVSVNDIPLDRFTDEQFQTFQREHQNDPQYWPLRAHFESDTQKMNKVIFKGENPSFTLIKKNGTFIIKKGQVDLGKIVKINDVDVNDTNFNTHNDQTIVEYEDLPIAAETFTKDSSIQEGDRVVSVNGSFIVDFKEPPILPPNSTIGLIRSPHKTSHTFKKNDLVIWHNLYGIVLEDEEETKEEETVKLVKFYKNPLLSDTHTLEESIYVPIEELTFYVALSPTPVKGLTMMRMIEAQYADDLDISKITCMYIPHKVFSIVFEISPTLIVAYDESDYYLFHVNSILPYDIKPHPQSILAKDKVIVGGLNVAERNAMNIRSFFKGSAVTVTKIVDDKVSIEENKLITVSLKNVLRIIPSKLPYYYAVGDPIHLTNNPKIGGIVVRENIDGLVIMSCVENEKINLYSVEVSKITRGSVLSGGEPTIETLDAALDTLQSKPNVRNIASLRSVLEQDEKFKKYWWWILFYTLLLQQLPDTKLIYTIARLKITYQDRKSIIDQKKDFLNTHRYVISTTNELCDVSGKNNDALLEDLKTENLYYSRLCSIAILILIRITDQKIQDRDFQKTFLIRVCKTVSDTTSREVVNQSSAKYTPLYYVKEVMKAFDIPYGELGLTAPPPDWYKTVDIDNEFGFDGLSFKLSGKSPRSTNTTLTSSAMTRFDQVSVPKGPSVPSQLLEKVKEGRILPFKTVDLPTKKEKEKYVVEKVKIDPKSHMDEFKSDEALQEALQSQSHILGEAALLKVALKELGSYEHADVLEVIKIAIETSTDKSEIDPLVEHLIKLRSQNIRLHEINELIGLANEKLKMKGTQDTVVSTKTKAKTIQHLQRITDEVQIDLAASKAELQKLMDEKKTVESELTTSKERVASIEAELKETTYSNTTERDILVQELDAAKGTIDELEYEKSAATDQLAHMEKVFEEQITQMKEQFESNKKQYIHETATLLAKKTEEMEKRRLDYEAQLELTDIAQREQLTATYEAEKEQLNQQHDKTVADMTATHEQVIREKQLELEGLMRTKETLEQQLESASDTLTFELQEKQREIEAVQAELAEMKAKNENTEDKNEQLRLKCLKFAGLMIQKRRLQQKKYEKRVKDLNDTVKNTEEEVARLKLAVDESSKAAGQSDEVDRLNRELADVRQTSQQQVEGLQSELEDIKSELSKNIDEFSVNMSTLSQTVEDTIAELEAAKEELTATKGELGELKAASEKVHEKYLAELTAIGAYKRVLMKIHSTFGGESATPYEIEAYLKKKLGDAGQLERFKETNDRELADITEQMNALIKQRDQEFETANGTLRAKIAELEADQSDHTSELERIKAEHETLLKYREKELRELFQATIDEYRQSDSFVNSTLDTFDDVLGESSLLNETVEKIKKVHDETIQELNAKLAHYTKTNEQLEREKQELITQMKEDNVEELNAKYEELLDQQKDYNDIQSKLAKFKLEQVLLLDTISSLQNPEMVQSYDNVEELIGSMKQTFSSDFGEDILNAVRLGFEAAEKARDEQKRREVFVENLSTYAIDKPASDLSSTLAHAIEHDKSSAIQSTVDSIENLSGTADRVGVNSPLLEQAKAAAAAVSDYYKLKGQPSTDSKGQTPTDSKGQTPTDSKDPIRPTIKSSASTDTDPKDIGPTPRGRGTGFTPRGRGIGFTPRGSVLRSPSPLDARSATPSRTPSSARSSSEPRGNPSPGFMPPTLKRDTKALKSSKASADTSALKATSTQQKLFAPIRQNIDTDDVVPPIPPDVDLDDAGTDVPPPPKKGILGMIYNTVKGKKADASGTSEIISALHSNPTPSDQPDKPTSYLAGRKATQDSRRPQLKLNPEVSDFLIPPRIQGTALGTTPRALKPKPTQSSRGTSVDRPVDMKGGTRKKRGSKKNTPLQYGKPSSKRKKIHGSYRQRSQ